MSFKFLIVFFLTLPHFFSAVAQVSNLSQQDISQLRVDQLSDAQLRQYVERADAQGISDQEIESQALVRGMSSAEVSKLMSRIRNIRQTMGRSNRAATGGNTNANLSGTNGAPLSQRDSALDSLTSEERKIFGFTLFNNEELTFEPSLNLATPQNYQVGPGDELLVNIWGASRQTYNLEVDRGGVVSIDNLGPVYINGLTIEEAEEKIINRLAEIYAGLRDSRERPANTFAEVSLGQVRSIKVNVVGEVRRPGTYTVSSLASPFNLLYLAGGPSVIGSFRNIEIERNGQVIAEMDVYDYLVGNAGEDHFVSLQDQDIVRVIPYDTRIELSGQVKRPGYYEMKNDESLAEAIRFGGGFTDKAYTHLLRVIRNTSRAKRILDVSENEITTIMPQNGDIVSVDSILDRFENRVEIVGAIFRPGEYALTEGLTVAGLIKKAEGLREDAFATRGLIYRKGNDLATNVVSVDLQGILAGEKPDVPLQREDALRIYSVFDLEEEFNVSINGEVQSPGQVPYMRGMTLEDLVAIAGGLKESASQARVEVARRVKGDNDEVDRQDISDVNLATAETFQFEVDKFLELGEADSQFKLMPYDQVFVRRSPGYEEQQTVYIDGEVQYPGAYVITNKSERISDLINRAGGLTAYAYEEGAQLIRLNPAFEEEKSIKEEMLRDSLRALRYQARYNNALQQQNQISQGNGNQPRPVQQNVYVDEDLLEGDVEVPKYKIGVPETQSIGIQLSDILKKPQSKYDLRLVPGDTLEIPRELETVRISGRLLYPIASRYDKSKTFKSYIADAGGFAEDADRRRSYVVYADGSADRTRSFLFFKNYPEIKPGAEIVIPREPPRQRLTAQAWIGIGSGLASIGLATATILTIINNNRDRP